MNRYIAIVLMGLAVLSCKDPLAELEIVEFGAVISEGYDMPLSYQAGEFRIDVISDGDFEAVVEEGGDWLSFEGDNDTYAGGSDVTSLTVYYMPNRTVLRSGKIVLTRGRRKVEFEVSQVGILSEDFSIEKQNLSAGYEGGDMRAKVLVLAGPEDMETSVEYFEPDQGGWISQVAMQNNYLRFHVSENLSETVRHAVITLRKKGTDKYGCIQVSQACEGLVYEDITIAQLRELMPDGGRIERHLVLSDGIVLNDNLEGNGADNRMVSAAIQDLKAAERMLYVSDSKGNMGLRLDFAEGAQLLVKRFDHIKVDLFGTVLVKEEDPEHYYVCGIPGTSVLENEVGSEADVEPKRKTWSELVDTDLFTLVELVNFEIPIRKGPFVGIDLRYYNIMTKYPMVIRDVEGNSTHMMVNTTCTWQRDGNIMPQGALDITGVLVHEHCDNFEWSTEAASAKMAAENLMPEYVTGIGEIGRYQIRPIRKEDIRPSQDYPEGFSELLCEFRYYDKEDKLMINATDTTLMSRGIKGDTLAVMTLWKLEKETDKPIQQKFKANLDWTMLGPYVDGKIADIYNGNGVVCERENATSQSGFWYHNATADAFATKYGILMSVYGSAWSASAWSKKKYWQVEFSTVGLDESNAPLSIQIGTVNEDDGGRIGGPVNWALEYMNSDGSWETIAKYTVPDYPAAGSRKVWQLPGHKYMTFNLPESLDLWGKESVKVRMRPANHKVGTMDSYDGTTTINQLVDNSINYFAVRYNKK